MSVWLSCKLYVRVSYTVRVCCICKHCSLPTLNRDMNTHHMTLPSLLVPLSAATIKILAAKFLPLLSPTLLPPAGWGGCIWGELCIALSQGEKKKSDQCGEAMRGSLGQANQCVRGTLPRALMQMEARPVTPGADMCVRSMGRCIKNLTAISDACPLNM